MGYLTATIYSLSFALIMFSNCVNAISFSSSVNLNLSPLDMADSEERINKLKRFSLGGVTPSYQYNDAIITKLKDINFNSLRLINVDRKVRLTISRDKVVSVKWSSKLLKELKVCKEEGFVPHIILSQEAPNEISRNNNEWVYGPASWEIYNQFIYKYIELVTQEFGFKHSIWEVGNEMDSPHQNWLVSSKMKTNLTHQGYDLYVKLYDNVSRTFSKYKSENPEFDIYLGGPGLTQFSFDYPVSSYKNWLVKFVSDIKKYNLIVDFFSFHFYGNADSGKELLGYIKYLKSTMQIHNVNTPIWVTEWGASFLANSNGAINFLPYSGSFAYEFISNFYNHIDKSLFLATRKFPGKNIPTLLNSDTSESHVYKVLKWIHGVNGRLLKCHADVDDIGCLAYEKNGLTYVSVWYSGWMNQATLKDYKNPWNSFKYVNVNIVDNNDRHKLLELNVNGVPYNRDTIKAATNNDKISYRLSYGSYSSFVIKGKTDE